MTTTEPQPGIVDAHHHLWDLSMFPYAWLRRDAPPRPFGDHSAIKRDYLPADYRRDSADLGIVETVHVEAAPGAADPAAETRWLEAQADTAGLPDASVAHIDLLAPTLDRDLNLLMGNRRLRGVRVGIAWRDRSPWRFAPGRGWRWMIASVPAQRGWRERACPST